MAGRDRIPAVDRQAAFGTSISGQKWLFKAPPDGQKREFEAGKHVFAEKNTLFFS